MKLNIKRSFKLLVFFLSVISLSISCTEDKYITEEVYIDNPTQWHIGEFTVNQSDWKWDSSNSSYYFEFSYPELTQKIAEDGLVIGSVYVDNAVETLAYTSYFENEFGSYCAETISFKYGRGYVRFYISSLDLFDNTPVTFKPQTLKFKVSLTWNAN